VQLISWIVIHLPLNKKKMKALDHKNPWITHDTEVKYENPWIRVSESKVTNPSGGSGIYGVVHYKNRAVGVIPVDAEGCTYLVGQYRYALNTYEWEIPEGGCPAGESLEAAARRELQEETGLVAGTITPILMNLSLSNSVSDERGFLFLAENLSQGDSAPEETEHLTVRHLPLAEAIEMVMRGEITDSMSVAGLLRMALLKR
jgi:8-oxo-dGTP pyrophosphatase MutT (NUDIX family)